MSQGKYSKWRKWGLAEELKAAMKPTKRQQIALGRDEPVWKVKTDLGNNFLYYLN